LLEEGMFISGIKKPYSISSKAKWVQAVYVFNGRINVLWSECAEKRKEPTHYGQNEQQWLGHYRPQPEVDLLYLCDSETTLDKVSRWIGSGPRTTLAGDANADIMKTIIECVRERVIRGARTFIVKVKAHRGEPLNERADTHAERARHLPPECRQLTTRTSRMLYTWQDKGVKRVSTWSKAVRRAMLNGGAELQRQKVLNRAATRATPRVLTYNG
jgi:hypothetical protein